MASYYVRKIGRLFYVYFIERGRTPREKSHPLGPKITRRTLAEKKAKTLFDHYLDGTFDPWTGLFPRTQTNLTLNDALELFLGEKNHLRPKSRESYRTAVTGLAGTMPIGATLSLLEPANVRAYVNAPEIAQESRRTRYRSLRAFFNWAIEAGHLTVSPLAKMKIPKPSGRDADYLSQQAFARLLNHLSKQAEAGENVGWLRDAIVVAVGTGMRRGELCALRWDAVDFENQFIRILNQDGFSTKSGKDRLVAMVPDVESVLRRLHEEGAGTGFVLRGVQGKRLNDQFLSKRFKQLVRETGLREGIHWHSLRHTHASWLVMDGVPLQVVGKALGHSSVSVTERYAHLSPDAMKRGVMSTFGQGILGGAAVQEEEGEYELP